MRQRGLSLIEILMSLAIIGLLFGIIMTALAPVREKGRQAGCISNLRQIGQAIAIYRQEHGGSDEPGKFFEMGLPPSVTNLPLFAKSPNVYQCPSERWHEPMPSDYFTGICDERVSGSCWPAGPFSQRVAEKGEDEFPLLHDPWHDSDWLGSRGPHLVIVLRLSGRVHSRMVPADTPSWDF